MKTNSIIINRIKYHGNHADELFPIDFIFSEQLEYYNIVKKLLYKSYKENKSKINKNIKKALSEASKIDNTPGLKYTGAGASYMSLAIGNIVRYDKDLRINYPNQFRKFFLVQSYSFIESELKYICWHTYNHSIKKIKPPDKHHIYRKKKMDMLNKHILFLCELFDFNSDDIKIELDQLQAVRVVRNYIIHNSSSINKEDNSNDFKELQRLASSESLSIELIKQCDEDKCDEYLCNENNCIKNNYSIELTNDDLIIGTIESGKQLFKKLIEGNLIRI